VIQPATACRRAACALAIPLLVLSGCRREQAAPPATTVDGRGIDAQDPAWTTPLARRIEALDAASPGELGVYIRHLHSGAEVRHDADRSWYLSSTVKVPVAIAVLQLADEGVLSLDEELVLQESDFVDGAGDLLWQEPGSRFALHTLLRKSLRHSDSTATDMLIRRIGVDELNHRIHDWVGDGFGPLTTILQVRYDAYGRLHPGVAKLSNMDLVRLKNADAGNPRLQALAARLGVQPGVFAFDSIEEGFEAYYRDGTNAATLRAFGNMLRRLVEGELLSEQHTALLLGHMREISTGDHRIRAGLPDDVAFAQKTGTQVERACNVGIIAPQQPARALVVVACIERFGEIANAEATLRGLGEAIVESGALQP